MKCKYGEEIKEIDGETAVQREWRLSWELALTPPPNGATQAEIEGFIEHIAFHAALARARSVTFNDVEGKGTN